jgi:hypothetical protein
MATATPIFDGHDALTGMEGGNPSIIGASSCANAVNRSFRGGYNRTRTPFRELALTFASDADAQLFRTGNVQGAFFYSGRPPTTNQVIGGSVPLYWPNYIVVAIAGTIFGIQLSGKTGTVINIRSGNNPLLMHTWFEQGYEWLFAQNGEENCIIWNGQDPTNAKNCFRSQPTLNQMPTGGPMAFIYGRMVVTSADGRNQIAVSDIAYGNHQNNSSDIYMFTDQTYWNEGGYFDIAASLGDIMGITPMPYLDTGSGQNELVVLCRNGATSFDFSAPRANWLNTQVQRISLVGMGCASTHSLALVNGDLVYKSKDGIRTYRNSRQEFASGYSQVPISYDVDKWLSQENKSLLEFSSQISWNNMLFSTVMPMMQANVTPGYGYHRYHRGMVVLDFQTNNKLSGSTPMWYGLWTGIRPTALVQGYDGGNHRAFVFSFDCDGQNRVYEFEEQGDYDFGNGQRSAIVSFYDTPRYCGIQSNRFTHKRLIGGNIELSEINDPVGLTIQYKLDNAPVFLDWKSTTVGCTCTGLGQNQSWDRKDLGQPNDACVDGSRFLANIFRASQFRIKLTGAATVDRFGVTMVTKEQTNKDNFAEPTACAVPSAPCSTVQCPDTGDFDYSIVNC